MSTSMRPSSPSRQSSNLSFTSLFIASCNLIDVVRSNVGSGPSFKMALLAIFVSLRLLHLTPLLSYPRLLSSLAIFPASNEYNNQPICGSQTNLKINNPPTCLAAADPLVRPFVLFSFRRLPFRHYDHNVSGH